MNRPSFTRRALVSALAGVALTASLGVLAQGFQVHYRVAGIVPASEPVPESSFTSHTFTNCGQTGRFGPSLARCETAYSGSEILSPQYEYSNQRGIQSWKIPVNGIYNIRAEGASGGSNPSGIGGRGAVVSANFTLAGGEVINILVGQMGSTDDWKSGGGGGTFVWKKNDISEPLIVAGGGGGASDEKPNGVNASFSTSGTSNRDGTATGGTGGHGGNIVTGMYPATAGAGWKSDGKHGLTACANNSQPSRSPLNGGEGSPGAGNDGYLVPGGFGGGGGGASRCGSAGGGGGGGYSGGAGGNFRQNGADSGGGGGGSYDSGTDRVDIGYNTGHGRVTITLLSQ